jgi:hypothetical protein
MTTVIKKLKAKYEATCMEWVELFCEKQKIEFSYWGSNEVGGIACFIDEYFFNLSDIILDLTTNQPKGLILRWQNDGIAYNFSTGKSPNINYKSYTMGLRYAEFIEPQK